MENPAIPTKANELIGDGCVYSDDTGISIWDKIILNEKQHNLLCVPKIRHKINVFVTETFIWNRKLSWHLPCIFHKTKNQVTEHHVLWISYIKFSVLDEEIEHIKGCARGCFSDTSDCYKSKTLIWKHSHNLKHTIKTKVKWCV